jgi:hypothetical protein
MDGPAMRAQVDAVVREYAEGGRRRRELGGIWRASDEALLEGVEAQTAVGAEDHQFAFILSRSLGCAVCLGVRVVDTSTTGS